MGAQEVWASPDPKDPTDEHSKRQRVGVWIEALKMNTPNRSLGVSVRYSPAPHLIVVMKGY